MDYTYEWIRAYTDGIKVLYAGAGHGVSALEIRHVGEFIDVRCWETRRASVPRRLRMPQIMLGCQSKNLPTKST